MDSFTTCLHVWPLCGHLRSRLLLIMTNDQKTHRLKWDSKREHVFVVTTCKQRKLHGLTWKSQPSGSLYHLDLSFDVWEKNNVCCWLLMCNFIIEMLHLQMTSSLWAAALGDNPVNGHLKIFWWKNIKEKIRNQKNLSFFSKNENGHWVLLLV